MGDQSEELRDFLQAHGLAQYFDAMAAEDISMDVLGDLEDADLRELGLSLGHRKALLKALETLAGNANPEQGEQRRQVTVFFCDLVGSTEIAGRYDAEDMADILERYTSRATKVIEAWGGLCLGTQGDGLVACFGYPTASERDAENAARAALELSSSVPQITFDDGLVLHTRIGLATGRVFVRGNVSDSSALVGDAMNLASRIQDEAPIDGVLAGQNTKRLIERSALLSLLGAYQLKGFDQPIQLWRLDGMQAEAERQALLASRPLGAIAPTGREAEFGQILDCWEKAKGGVGQVITLKGEAGIGKSVLVEAAFDLAREQEATVVRFFCAAGYENSALYPVRTQLNRVLGLAEATSSAEVATRLSGLPECDNAESLRLMADLLHVDPGTQVPVYDGTATQQKLGTFALLRTQLASLTTQAPLMILFEDAHWADPTTLELVNSIIMETVPGRRILLLITHRMLTDLGVDALDHVTSLEIKGLGPVESRAIVTKIMGDQALPADILHTITTAADGNPLFLEELSRSVAEQKDIMGLGYHDLQVPITLEDSLRGRLDRLRSGKQLVQTAAVMGRRFQTAALARTLQVEPEACVQSAQEPLKANLLSKVAGQSDDELMFHHALVQQAAYEGIARKQRQTLHARIAEMLPEMRPDIAETEPETLARHHAGAGNFPVAIQFLIAAGKSATARAAQVEATNHYFTALDHLSKLPDGRPRDETEVLLRALLGGALMATRGFAAPEVYDAFARSRALCLMLGDSPIYCSAIYGLFTVAASRSEKAEALKLADEMLAAFGDCPVPSWCIAAHFASGVARFFEGAFDQAEIHFDHVLEIYTPDQHAMLVEQFGDNLAEFSMCYRHWLYLLRGQLRQSAEILARAETMAKELNNKNALIRAISFQMGRALELGDGETILRLAPKVIEMSTAQGYPYWACAGQIGMGWAMCAAGQEDGIAPIVGSLGFFDMIGQRMPQAYWRSYLISAHVHLGQKSKALSAANTALEMARGGLDHAFEPAILINRGKAELLEPADPVAAEASFREALDIANAKCAHLYVMQAATELSRLLVASGRANEENGVLEATLKRIESDEAFSALDDARDALAKL